MLDFQDLVFVRSNSIIPQNIEGEYVLVPVVSNVADMNSVYNLDNVAAFIWESLDGHNSVKDIVIMVVKEFDVDSKVAKNDVIEYIKDLMENKIIDKQNYK